MAVGSVPGREIPAATGSSETELRALQIRVFARNPTAGAAAATILTGDPSGSTPHILLAVDTRYKHYVMGSQLPAGSEADAAHAAGAHLGRRREPRRLSVAER